MSAAITILAGFARNAAFLLSLAFLYSLILPGLRRLQPKSRTALSGALFGLIAILGMLTPIQVEPGIIVDGRVVVVALALVFEGTGAGLITTALVIAFRSWLGGVGTIPGEGAILTAFLLGALVHRRWEVRLGGFGPKQFLLLGAGLAVSGLLWTLALPDPLVARRVFRMLAFPVGLGFPVATLLLGTLLSHQIRRHEAEEAVTRAREELEQQVADRTTELSKSNALLQGEIAERRRAEEALRTSEGLLREAQHMAHIGHWELDRVAGTPRWSEEIFHIFGLDPSQGEPSFEDHQRIIHPDDWHVLHGAVTRAIIEGLAFDIEFRLLRPDNSIRWMNAKGQAVQDADGHILGIFGTAQDITQSKRAEEALHESEERYRSLFENMLDGFAYCRMLFEDNRPQDFIYLAVNSAFEKLTGLKNVVGRKVTEAIPGIRKSHPELFETYGRVALGGPPERFELYFEPLAAWLSISVYSTEKGCFAAVFENITERKRAEEELRARTQQLEAVRAVSAEITHELDLRNLLQLVDRRAAELVGAERGAILLWDEAHQHLVPQAWPGYGPWVGDVRPRLGEGVAGLVAERREGLIVNDYRNSPHAHPLFLERSLDAAVLCEPLLYRDRLLGVILLAGSPSHRQFSSEDQQLLRLFAAQAAIAIENARLHQTTVQRAKRLATLNELMRKLTTLLDPPQLAREILQAVQDLIPDAVSRLWEYVEGVDELHVVASVGLQAAEAGYRLRLRRGEGFLGTAIATRQPVISRDVVRDPRFVNKAWGAAEGLVSSIALPLVYGERVTGGLVISTRQPHDFTDEEVNLLQSFAAQAAIALENARFFEQVREGRERLQSLSRQLVEVQEGERRNIARELHDEIGQLLTGLKLLLEMGARVRPEKVKARLSEAQALVNELITRVRELSLDLRPAMLDDLGVLPALLWHFERFTELSRVRVVFRHSGLEEQRFSPEVETAAYRIVQEALTNVARHAKVAEVAVRLWVDENTLDLRIEDRGAGFDPEATLSAAASSGLAGMRERAVLLGGRLTVTSTSGGGTQVMAELPLTGKFEKRRKPR